MSTSTINRYLGSSLADNSIPVGAVMCEIKYCEVCGRPFVRKFAPTEPTQVKEHEVGMTFHGRADYGAEYIVVRRRDHGQRFCGECRGRELQPDVKSQERYKAQLPNQREGHHNRVYQMPRY